MNLRPPYSHGVRLLDHCSRCHNWSLKRDSTCISSGTDLSRFIITVSELANFAASGIASICRWQWTKPGSFDCFTEDLHSRQIIFPCLNTLAMGDNQAVELGQKAHVRLGVLARAFSPFELLSIHGRPTAWCHSCWSRHWRFHYWRKAPRGSLQWWCIRRDKEAGSYLWGISTAGPFASSEKDIPIPEFCWILGRTLQRHFRSYSTEPEKVDPTHGTDEQNSTPGICNGRLVRNFFRERGISVLQSRRRMLCLLQNIYTKRSEVGIEEPLLRCHRLSFRKLWLLCILGPASLQWFFVLNLSLKCSGPMLLLGVPLQYVKSPHPWPRSFNGILWPVERGAVYSVPANHGCAATMI